MLAACGGDGDTTEPDASATTEELTVRLEPIGQTFDGAFTEDLDLDPPGADLAIALPDVPPLGTGVAGALAGRSASGADVGLYGGSRDAAVCDVDQLVAFLTDPANLAKAEAWAAVLSLDVDAIEAYVRTLTATRLRHDTRVTNHGFADGEPAAAQAVLQAGTAVLVDDLGVPRIKCSCGNPLLEPTATDGEVVANPGDAWDGFAAASVVVVRPAETPLTELTMLDLETGELFERPAGSNGNADRDVADLAGKCALVPESASCADTSDAETFCSMFRDMSDGPSFEYHASSDGVSSEVVVENEAEVLAHYRSIAPELERLPQVAPDEIRADVQALTDAALAGLAAEDATLLLPSLDVLTRLGTFIEANCT